MSHKLLPLTLPSSTKTIVGLSPDDYEEAEPLSSLPPPPPPPQRPQRTLLGAGPEHEELVKSFVTSTVRSASDAPLPPPRRGRTLVGLAPEAERPQRELPAPRALAANRAPAAPCALPGSYPVPDLAAAPLSSGPVTVASAGGSEPSLSELPLERSRLIAFVAALVVLLWALTLVWLLSV